MDEILKSLLTPDLFSYALVAFLLWRQERILSKINHALTELRIAFERKKIKTDAVEEDEKK